MFLTDSDTLKTLCLRHGVSAAICLEPRASVSFLPYLSQKDYARLLLLSQAQTSDPAEPKIDLVQLDAEPALVFSAELDSTTSVILVYPFETRLRDCQARSAAFLRSLKTQKEKDAASEELRKLKARKNQPAAENDLLNLFLNLPNAEPAYALSSQGAEPDYPMQELDLQTIPQKGPWEKIF